MARRRRRNIRRDARGRFAKSASAARKLIKSNAKVGHVGSGGHRGVSISGTRTISRGKVKVSVYGSASVGAKLVR